eukprot:TRINITY_DN12174_c0_g2_i1.p1 TRINITY_DN12174_c0_g2~~TRINITY_DN12174_c0_g2_i1.p1  ORF type:complete len:501 (+),score=43.89 TRINITY_DN12174_c0_g2_i1:1026-2528(+)
MIKQAQTRLLASPLATAAFVILPLLSLGFILGRSSHPEMWSPQFIQFNYKVSTQVQASKSVHIQLPSGVKRHLRLGDLALPDGRPKYSTHRCVGYHERPEWVYRKCSFQNVCYNFKSRGVRYFVNPAFRWPQIFPVDQPPQTSFFSPYVAFKTNAMSNEGINPEADVWAENNTFPEPFWNISYVPGISAIYHPVTENFNMGHYLLDDVYSIFDLLQVFDLLHSPKPVQIISNLPCSAVADAATRHTCQKFSDSFWRGISDQKVLGFPEINDKYGGQGDVVCFEQLLIGTGNSGIIAGKHSQTVRYSRAASLWEFRNSLLRGLNFDPLRVPTEHLVLIFRKSGRRGLHNVDEILAAIRKERRYEGVSVRVLENVDDMPIRDQLELVTRSTVVVSPPGGASSLFFFLPRGAHLIVADYWYLKATSPSRSIGMTQHMDDSLWDFISHVKTQYYDVRKGEVFVPPGLDPTDNRVLRDDCEVIVNLDRLFLLIDAALFDMSQPKN